MSLRMVSFLLPIPKNTEERRDPTHQAVKGALLRISGGYTTSIVTGAYRMNTGVVAYDTCVKYEIAIDLTLDFNDGSQANLYEIARNAGIALYQESVLFVTANGDVLFIPCLTDVAVCTNTPSQGWDVC